jgi:aminopeptidase
VKAQEKVYVEMLGNSALPLLSELIREAYALGALPYFEQADISVMREFMLGCSREQLDLYFTRKAELISAMDVYVLIGGQENKYEFSDVPKDKMELFLTAQRKIVNERMKKRYIVLKAPNYGMAQMMNRSLRSMEHYYFQACTFDYTRLGKEMANLAALMERTNQVRIVARDTDLTLSIKDMPIVKCDGRANLPDGEIFTAPLKTSINGHIRFNAPSSYRGTNFSDISLKFHEGRIVQASANNSEALHAILDIDDGARFIGEFAMGLNPFVREPVNDILFDEKMTGSIHLTPGQAYPFADNGNRSKIHWDLILSMQAAHGGGSVFFDDVLVQQDGLFVLDELKGLNPGNFGA